VLDVTLDDGSRGLVTVSLREGALRAVDEQGERGSALSGAALSFLGALAGKDAAASLGPLAGVDRAAPRPSHAPPARSLDAARELALSLVRSGLAGARRGAIDEPLRRARASGELRIARWAARFEAAVAAEDLPLLAQLARGVLGAPPAPVSSRVDLRLVEVAREHVDATGARSLARRHLLDPASGSAFVEEHDAGAPPGSIGPIEDPGQPSLRVLQYTTSPIVPSELYARLFELACRDVSAALDHVDRLVRASPAFAEPLVLFAPDRWDSVRALDAAGRELPLSAHEDPAASLRLGEVLAEREPALVVVRAAPLHGVHAFVPLSCVLAEPTGGWRFVRLRG
jgi:hypothetical protein